MSSTNLSGILKWQKQQENNRVFFNHDMLKQLIKLSPLDISTFAGMVNVTRDAVNKWINGTNTPSLESLCLICEVLNISPSKLLNIEYKK